MVKWIQPIITSIQKNLNINYRPVRKDPKCLMVNKLNKEFFPVQKLLENQKITLQTHPSSLIRGQPLQSRTVNTRSAKIAQCGTVALNAKRIVLPKKCVLDEGVDFMYLLAAALAVNPSSTSRITVLELVNFVDTNKHISGHIAQKFQKYTLDHYLGFRQLSKPWLRVIIELRAVAKVLTDYGGINSSEHKEYFNKLGLTINNFVKWMVEILEDRCYSPIHSYELTNKSIKVCYHIPIAIRPGPFTLIPIARDLSNFFNSPSDLVDSVWVFEYENNSFSNRSTIMPGDPLFYTGKLITGFLQNRRLAPVDIAALLWFTPNTNPWGNNAGVITHYTQTTGKTGMPFFAKGKIRRFPVLPTMPTPNRSSKGNLAEDYYRKLPINRNKKNIYIPLIKISKDDEKRIVALSLDPAYKTKTFHMFAPYLKKISDKIEKFINQIP